MQDTTWTTRLYLLDHGLTNIVIEVSDVHASPGTLADYEPVIDALAPRREWRMTDGTRAPAWRRSLFASWGTVPPGPPYRPRSADR